MTLKMERQKWYESNSKYQVLDTDYETYSIVYTCYSPYLYGKPTENFWIFTSEPLDWTKKELYAPFHGAVQRKLWTRFKGSGKLDFEYEHADWLMRTKVGDPIKFPNNDYEKCEVFDEM